VACGYRMPRRKTLPLPKRRSGKSGKSGWAAYRDNIKAYKRKLKAGIVAEVGSQTDTVPAAAATALLAAAAVETGPSQPGTPPSPVWKAIPLPKQRT
jgi:hypothetical protein